MAVFKNMGADMRVAVCDDETAQQQLMEKYLREWGGQRSILMDTVMFPDGESLLFAWEEDKAFDLLILDIEMHKINGMALAQEIRRTDEAVPILFVTGYDEYMPQGYEVSAIHYLVKPVSKEKLFQVLDRLQDNVKREKKFLFKTGETAISLPASKIWYVEACAHKCVLYTEDAHYELRRSITEIEEYLMEDAQKGTSAFMRCHRSYLVNLQHISGIAKNELITDNGNRLPVSRNAYKEINEAFIRMHVKAPHG